MIFHRDHLAVISNEALLKIGGVYHYNFTDGVDRVYGGISGHKELAPGVWGMISGDFYSEGMIDSTDFLFWKSNAAFNGYLNADGNLDGQVDNKDKNDYLLPNLGKGSQVPD
ncbi:MAG: hypothetical protein R2750_00800 [Bacteroidales bacterium]